MASGETFGSGIGGAVQGASSGSAFGPVGAVVGGGLGLIQGLASGALSSRGRAKARRARRRQLFQQIEQLQALNRKQLEQSRRLRSSQRAAFGAAGVKSTTGTARQVQEQTLQDAVLDQERILRGVRAIREQIRREHRGAQAIDTSLFFAESLRGITGGLSRRADLVIARGE